MRFWQKLLSTLTTKKILYKKQKNRGYNSDTIDIKIYDIGSDEQFLKVDCGHDSYGENYSIQSASIVKMKKVTTVTFDTLT